MNMKIGYDMRRNHSVKDCMIMLLCIYEDSRTLTDSNHKVLGKKKNHIKGVTYKNKTHEFP